MTRFLEGGEVSVKRGTKRRNEKAEGREGNSGASCVEGTGNQTFNPKTAVEGTPKNKWLLAIWS
jgi:hypothetical protein